MDFKEIGVNRLFTIAHDPADDTLFVQFHQGRRYAFEGVSEDTVAKMMEAENPERYFHQAVKPYYKGYEVTNE